MPKGNPRGGGCIGQIRVCVLYCGVQENRLLKGVFAVQKTDFIKAVAEEAGMSQKDTRQVIDAAIDVITRMLQQGEKVTLTGFGTFEVRSRSERRGINPQTREPMEIPATRTPGFSAGSALREAVRNA